MKKVTLNCEFISEVIVELAKFIALKQEVDVILIAPGSVKEVTYEEAQKDVQEKES